MSLPGCGGEVPIPSVTRERLFELAISGVLALGLLALAVSLLTVEGTVSAKERGAGGVTSGGAMGESIPTQLLSADGTPYLNCRFGVGQSENPVISYDVAPLNLGWYANWGARGAPARPGGMEYVQVLRVSDGAGYGERRHPDPPSYRPSGDALAAIIAANPGSLWLVGNEPDCIWQDNVLPQNYARAYHDAYAFIKQHDPTARVAVGGIVQPTPLRMEYLDIVLDTYLSLYGEALPTDAWHIHSFILREASCDVYEHCWGSEIPPGINADSGEMYEIWEADDLDIFRARILAFRGWMRERGYRDEPLYITEYGSLWPYYESPFVTNDGKDVFDEARAARFLTSTFDLLLSASDSTIGYRADQNRLVQRWLWYSLDGMDYGGALFDKDTVVSRPLGIDFADYTGVISPAVDLLAVGVGQAGPIPFSPTDTATVTLEVRISNAGNVAVTDPFTVRLLDGEGETIDDIVISKTLAGCAATWMDTVTWPNLAPGAHAVRVVVDPEDGIREADETNNDVNGVALVAEVQSFLPLITRDR